MTTREPTSVYPDNPRSEWVIRTRVAPALVSGLWRFEYEVYASQSSRDLGDRPFVLHSHIAQLRENHQRIHIGPSGGLLHVSGIEVPLDDVEAFLESDRRAYRWVLMTPVLWTDGRARTLTPFLFPTYWGNMEALDPQWQREQFTVPLTGQIEEVIQRQLLSDEQHRWSGDRRGTTLDLQVGASADDAHERMDNTLFSSTATNVNHNSSNGTNRLRGGHRFAGVTASGTADVAYVSVRALNTSNDDPEVEMQCEDVDDAVDFSTNADVASRTMTTAIPTWSATGIGTGEVNSPSIVTPVQEVFDRPGWASGQDLVVCMTGINNLSFKSFSTFAYDNDTTKALKAHIEYTAAGGAARRIFVVS